MPSVLLIDDDRENCCHFIERAFRKLAPGLEVFMFHYGEDALAHLGLCGTTRPLPGLVLLDRTLPNGPGGMEILRAIRALPALAVVPVWMLSARYLDEDVDEARLLGADEYLRKPTGDKYPELVQEILDRRPWRRGGQVFEHDPRTVPARTVSPVEAAVVPSPPMTAAAASAQPSFLHSLVANLAAYFPAIGTLDPAYVNGLCVDQDEVDITFAERQARITRAQVQDLVRFADQDMDRKRRKFFRVLFERGWALPQIRERFPQCREDYLKKIRALAHKSSTVRALPS